MISTSDARKKAMKGLRFDFGGSMLSLGKMRYCEESNAYVFSILISYPRVDYEEGDIEFDDTKMVGEIRVDRKSGELTNTPSEIINERVKEISEKGDIIYNN